MQRVSLWFRIISPDGRRHYVKPHLKRQRRTTSGESHPEGIYALRWQEGGRRRWQQVGNELGYAILRRDRLAAEILLGRHAEAAPKAERITIDDAIATYINNVKAMNASRTAKGYKYGLEQFHATCRKKYMDEIRRQDIINYVATLREAKLSDRTCANRVGEIVTFLRHFGIKNVSLRIKYTEKKVKAYKPSELKSLFAFVALS